MDDPGSWRPPPCSAAAAVAVWARSARYRHRLLRPWTAPTPTRAPIHAGLVRPTPQGRCTPRPSMRSLAWPSGPSAVTDPPSAACSWCSSSSRRSSRWSCRPQLRGRGPAGPEPRSSSSAGPRRSSTRRSWPPGGGPSAWPPRTLPDLVGFEIGRVYQAGSGLMAGDFYDLFRLTPTRVAAVIGDVAGHGIEPCHHRLPGQVPAAGVPPAVPRPGPGPRGAQHPDVGPRPGRGVHLPVRRGLRHRAGTLRYTSAGHPAAWLWHDREVRPLRATGPLLMLDPKAASTSAGRSRLDAERPLPALHRRPVRGPRRRASSSARTASPPPSGVTPASSPTYCASPCSRRPVTSPAGRSPTTSPSWPSAANRR